MIDYPAYDESDGDPKVQLEHPIGTAERELKTVKGDPIFHEYKPMIDCPVFDDYSVDNVRQLEELLNGSPSHNPREVVTISSPEISLCFLLTLAFEDDHDNEIQIKLIYEKEPIALMDNQKASFVLLCHAYDHCMIIVKFIVCLHRI